jgi:hypothetical protein
MKRLDIWYGWLELGPFSNGELKNIKMDLVFVLLRRFDVLKLTVLISFHQISVPILANR